MRLTSFGMVSSWEPVCAEASIPAKKIKRNHTQYWLSGLLQMYSNRITSFNLSTYPGSPGCYVQWGRGSAAWPAGEVWWAVERMEENTRKTNTHAHKSDLVSEVKLTQQFKAEILQSLPLLAKWL